MEWPYTTGLSLPDLSLRGVANAEFCVFLCVGFQHTDLAMLDETHRATLSLNGNLPV